jgi:hypothetical protein
MRQELFHHANRPAQIGFNLPSDVFEASSLVVNIDLTHDAGVVDQNASLAEFVGGLWFGESSKGVKQGHFHGFIGSKAEGSSGNHSYLVVETLDRTA